LIKYPFQKLLYYFAAISKCDKGTFGDLLEMYLPSVQFNFEDPFEYIKSELVKEPIPKGILLGSYTDSDFRYFLSKFNLTGLHSVFNDDNFQDILFDTDTRRKIDGMCLSSVFRKSDIMREFNNYNIIYIDSYTECISNYKQILYKESFIDNYIGDVNEKNLLKQVLKNTSRNKLKVLLGITISDIVPKKLIDNALQIISIKVNDALLAEDNVQLNNWLKFQVNVSEKLIKLGAGSKTDLDTLIDTLNAKIDFDEPVIYTKEQLESQFIETQKDAQV
jgi:hypothetical protein